MLSVTFINAVKIEYFGQKATKNSGGGLLKSSQAVDGMKLIIKKKIHQLII